MYYYKARIYSPTLGVVACDHPPDDPVSSIQQTDPIGYGDGMNLYAYTGNNPVNMADPRRTDATWMWSCYGHCDASAGYGNISLSSSTSSGTSASAGGGGSFGSLTICTNCGQPSTYISGGSGGIDMFIIGALLERIVEASSPSVIAAYETKIAKLEREKLVLGEKRPQAGQSRGRFEDMFELAMGFLANPSKLWVSGSHAHRRLVLKLTFADRLSYCRKSGFRTPETTLPFKALGSFREDENVMAERESAITANKILILLIYFILWITDVTGCVTGRRPLSG